MKPSVEVLRRSRNLWSSLLIPCPHSARPPIQFCVPRTFSSTCHRQDAAIPKKPFPHTSNGKRPSNTKSRFRILALVAIASALGYSAYTPSRDQKIFDPPRFTPFKIISKKDVSSTCIILTVRPQNLSAQEAESDPYSEWWQDKTWSVEVKQPLLQIARAYTPLPPRKGDRNGDLRFLIRKERNGEVSGYLHRLAVGDVVELRGPKIELKLDAGLEEVVFLAGGTGIAPALQVAHSLLERREGTAKARIRIAWANRKREDCVCGGSSIANRGDIVRELEAMREQYPDHLSVKYLVDEEGTLLDRQRISNMTRANPKISGAGNKSARLLVVSGPEGFINYLAGPKLWEGEGGQGQLGGVISELGLVGWQVWKM